MRPASPAIADALSSLRAMLEADGYALDLGEGGPNLLIAEIKAGPDACADCLVPKELMLTYFEKALESVLELGPPDIRLVYPGEDA